jgi:hypothetical protein
LKNRNICISQNMASSAQAAATVAEPFPIFTVAHKYILYDVDTVSHARANHNITGVLIGGLPQAPQQNVFSGIPLELMPEEARLLVEKGVAYLVDDVKAHKDNMLGNGLAPEERRAFQSALRKQGSAAAKDAERKMEERKKGALEKKFGSSDWNDIPEDMLMSNGKRGGKKGKRAGSRTPVAHSAAASGAATPAEEVESLFAPPTASVLPKLVPVLRQLRRENPPLGPSRPLRLRLCSTRSRHHLRKLFRYLMSRRRTLCSSICMRSHTSCRLVFASAASTPHTLVTLFASTVTSFVAAWTGRKSLISWTLLVEDVWGQE